MAGVHNYSTPKGEFHEVRLPDGKIRMEIKWNPGFGPKLSRDFTSAQRFIDTECLILSENMVPKDTGILKDSGVLNTQIGTGEVKYRTPYARRWYYRPAKFQQAPMRGNYWFERMKQQYKQRILSGAKKRIGG